MRQAAWALMILGLFVVMLGELDFLLVRTLHADHPSLLWPAVVIGSTLTGSGMLLLVGDRIPVLRGRRRRVIE